MIKKGFMCCVSNIQLNLGMYTKDKKVELSVLVDRATGGGSIKDGELELMLHRFQNHITAFNLNYKEK